MLVGVVFIPPKEAVASVSKRSGLRNAVVCVWCVFFGVSFLGCVCGVVYVAWCVPVSVFPVPQQNLELTTVSLCRRSIYPLVRVACPLSVFFLCFHLAFSLLNILKRPKRPPVFTHMKHIQLDG